MKPSQRSNAKRSTKKSSLKVTPRSFPFTAIVGQRDMLLALILNVIDPSIGGVLIMGHRGTGKSTAVRALGDLLPEIKVVAGCLYNCDPTSRESLCSDCATRFRVRKKIPQHTQKVKVVELPLGATEDRVCGSINIERALKEGTKAFEPGLLAQANRGFLYIDEVNLLEDHLVDVLLDVAATGWNRVEREGVSVEHPARFVLIGSGNPEEGELRPQLLDRFGLHVEVKTEDDLESRVAVVQRREAFDRDPISFARSFDKEQRVLAKSIEQAQRSFSKINISSDLLKIIAGICAKLNIEGHRGELTLMRAARALAALKGSKKVTEEDVKRVAPMVLQHRLRQNVFEDSATRERIMQAFDQAPLGEVDSKAVVSSQGVSSESTDDKTGQSEKVVELFSTPPAKQATKLAFSWKQRDSQQKWRGKNSRGAKRRVASEQRGRHVRSVAYKTLSRRVAVAATLRALLSSTTLLSRNDYSESLRYKLFSQKRGTLYIFIIDTSGSMGRHRIALAKRAILDLLRQSYLNRDSVAIITFRGVSATLALPPSRSILRARQAIESLTVGGSTPLSAGMKCAVELVRRMRDRRSDQCVLLFTDGRANVPLRDAEGSPAVRSRLIEEELKQMAAAIKQTRTKLVVVDTQRHFERNEQPGRLAVLMEAQLIKLEY